jgi:hypothetical protein
MASDKMKQERYFLNGLKSLGIVGMIMIFVTLAVFRLFFMESKAQSMERRPPAFNSQGEESEEFHQALEECAEKVEVDENGRPDFKAMDKCMSAKGFEKPAMDEDGHGRRKPPMSMTPPDHLQDGEE